MKTGQARVLPPVIAVVGVISGLISLGSSNQFDANLGVGLFAVGGVASVVYLALIASRELRQITVRSSPAGGRTDSFREYRSCVTWEPLRCG